MIMHNPPYPGEIIKALCLEPLGLSITEVAEALGVSRNTLSSIINGKAGISPEMAVRLSIAFNISSESWLNQQTQYELWQAEQHRKELKVKHVSQLHATQSEQLQANCRMSSYLTPWECWHPASIRSQHSIIATANPPVDVSLNFTDISSPVCLIAAIH